MVWPEEIQQKYEDELNTIAYGMIKVIHPGYQNRITELIYKTNDELNELMNNHSGTKQEYLARVENAKSELSALIEQDNKIVEDNKLIDSKHQALIEIEVATLKSNSSNKWIAIRNVRRLLLSECDWTQLKDTPITDEKMEEWASYRQSLRDIPENYTNIESIIWPIPPGE